MEFHTLTDIAVSAVKTLTMNLAKEFHADFIVKRDGRERRCNVAEIYARLKLSIIHAFSEECVEWQNVNYTPIAQVKPLGVKI